MHLFPGTLVVTSMASFLFPCGVDLSFLIFSSTLIAFDLLDYVNGAFQNGFCADTQQRAGSSHQITNHCNKQKVNVILAHIKCSSTIVAFR